MMDLRGYEFISSPVAGALERLEGLKRWWQIRYPGAKVAQPTLK
jgi:hypothetical protein